MGTHAIFIGFSDEQTNVVACKLFADPKYGHLHYGCSEVHPGFVKDYVRTYFRKGSWCLFQYCSAYEDTFLEAIFVRSRGLNHEPFEQKVYLVGDGFMRLDVQERLIKHSFRRVPCKA